MKLFIDSMWISPYTYTVFCALREKGIPFEYEVQEFSNNRSLNPDFRALVCTDLIPALQDDTVVLWESGAILEYLEEKHPTPSLFPASLEARAQARMLLSWYRTGLSALRNERSAETLFYEERRRGGLPALSPQAQEEISDWKRFLNLTLKPGAQYLFGGNWSIADTETALMLHRLILYGDPVEQNLVDYARGIWARPAIREFVEHHRPAYRSYY